MMAAATGPSDNGAACDLDKPIDRGQLTAIHSRRAVVAIALASAAADPPKQADAGDLSKLVAPDAEISSGGGDVVVPMGRGAKGLQALAKKMRAVSYRYFGWDYIPMMLENGCSAQEVSVEFTSITGRSAYPVQFTFKDGKIAKAKGWSRSLETGAMDSLAARSGGRHDH